jgi:hypothetical protein
LPTKELIGFQKKPLNNMTNKDEIARVDSDKFYRETSNEMQNINDAQLDMRVAYSHGYSGVIVSGLVWLVAGLVSIYVSPKQAVWTLLIGGVFIHPIGILFNKILGASGAHAKSNVLGRLAMEGTVFMIMCMPLAYALSFQKVEWFFQGMLMIIGGRYLTFATLFGTRLYWVLGMGLGTAAYLLFTLNSPSYISILVGSAIEITFGVVMLTITRKK